MNIRLHSGTREHGEAVAAMGGHRMTDTANCQWIEDDDGNWDTACGAALCFEYNPPNERGHKFCMNCGKPILLVQYQPPTEEDEP